MTQKKTFLVNLSKINFTKQTQVQGIYVSPFLGDVIFRATTVMR